MRVYVRTRVFMYVCFHFIVCSVCTRLSAGVAFRVADSPHLRVLVDRLRRLPAHVELQLPTRDTVSGGLLDNAVRDSTRELRSLLGESLAKFAGGARKCEGSYPGPPR
eukprot:GHVU01170072.1.p2 GENE.GHVU01170072.1~~GHVU01170072.1.p2  ORF type:complete len:108 (+),score=2.45 GHVU01170072.1:182-505(+)